MSDPSPATLGGYTLLDRIGAGGMGEVWLAERVGVGSVRRRAAIKRILPAFQSDPTLRERFLAEARITARLEHPNIVQVLDFGDSPELYLVLEYVEGMALIDWLKRAAKRAEPVPVAAALYIVAEAATGLDHAHRRTDERGRSFDIVHRDVSPSNILLSVDGAVKVNDFGVARAADNILRTQAGLAIGKLSYMAPEQARAESLDRRADVFALGIVLWELLTARPLLPRNDAAAALTALARCAFPPPSSYVPSLPRELDGLIAQALSASPNARPASAGAFASSLRALLATVSPGYDGRALRNHMVAAFPELAARGGARFTTDLPAHSAPDNAPPRAVTNTALDAATRMDPPRGFNATPTGSVGTATPIVSSPGSATHMVGRASTPSPMPDHALPPTGAHAAPPAPFPSPPTAVPFPAAPHSYSHVPQWTAPPTTTAPRADRTGWIVAGVLAGVLIMGGGALTMYFYLVRDNGSGAMTPASLAPTLSAPAGGSAAPTASPDATGCHRLEACCDAVGNNPDPSGVRESCASLRQYFPQMTDQTCSFTLTQWRPMMAAAHQPPPPVCIVAAPAAAAPAAAGDDACVHLERCCAAINATPSMSAFNQMCTNVPIMRAAGEGGFGQCAGTLRSLEQYNGTRPDYPAACRQ